MPLPRRGPTYIRQTSAEHVAPPPLIDAAYPASYDGPIPVRPAGPGTTRFTSPTSGTGLPPRPINRNNTVRGAVRGTIREKGSNPDQANYVPVRSLTRGKTLTRPDRFVAPAPLIDPAKDKRKSGLVTMTNVNGVATMRRDEDSFWEPWGLFVNVITFYAPRFLLASCGGITDRLKQRAWKEKVALCSIALIMGGLVAFLTIGLTRVLCPIGQISGPAAFISLGSQPGYVGIGGWNYNITGTGTTGNISFYALANATSGQDISYLFTKPTPPSCAGFTAKFATSNLCITSASDAANRPCPLGAPTTAFTSSLGLANTSHEVGFDWDQVASLSQYMVIDGNVLNMQSYMLANPKQISNDSVDATIRFVLTSMSSTGGKDGTRLFYNNPNLISSVQCLRDRYYAGHIDKITPGCFVSHLFLYFSLTVILAVVLIRFAMAFYFRWFVAHRLIQPPKNLRRKVISPSVLPEGANIDINNTTGSAPWSKATAPTPNRLRQNGFLAPNEKGGAGGGANGVGVAGKNAVGVDGMISMASIGAELFCVCLVTCYSEGEEGIRNTLDSIAATNYSDARKLMFIVCDGMITGDGEKLSTPDICVGMIERDERFGEPQAMTYEAVGEGSKGSNQAMIYAGHYVNVRGHRTPALVIVKTGLLSEANEKKPGNRGKRDSQMILMNFFSRVTYNDRMSPLDYDLFRKVQSLMGVTPDFFEVCLMVDADTKVYPDSLGYMIRCMQNDNMIMGLCGETRIANKRQSWVTMIQVFEYFISHHLSKAFESVFGGVNCLPGCFSMYRLKARKSGDGDWVPVLVQPQVISEYSQSTVVTLHQKNLLLLGEDRFLTTLLLRTFPNRKMIFCPQARCRTVVPHTFSVLLSQRRRWINSTVHNLMELVLVRNLCGTFCFSMQFVIFIDLIGTVVLPVAICLTYTLIINYIFNPPAGFSDAIPLLLLGAVLGLPAVLILITTFKLVYVGWMMIYLIALPIWNFVLPVYAFSKFDDFSWGETRKVAGERKGDEIHGRSNGMVAQVPLRKWEDWERQRVRKVRRDAKRRAEFERQFGSQRFLGADNTSSYEGSDTTSMMSSEEDRWGMEIGDYAEDAATSAPPPLGLYFVDETDAGHETLASHQLEEELERGWAEEDLMPPPLSSSSNQEYRSPPGASYSYDSRSASPPLPARAFSYSNSRMQHSSNSYRGGGGGGGGGSTSSLASSFDGPSHSNQFYNQNDQGSRSPLVPPPLHSSYTNNSSDVDLTWSSPPSQQGHGYGRNESPMARMNRAGSPSDNRGRNGVGGAEMNPFDEPSQQQQQQQQQQQDGVISPGGHSGYSRR